MGVGGPNHSGRGLSVLQNHTDQAAQNRDAHAQEPVRGVAAEAWGRGHSNTGGVNQEE